MKEGMNKAHELLKKTREYTGLLILLRIFAHSRLARTSSSGRSTRCSTPAATLP
jgi:hypothetical protein